MFSLCKLEKLRHLNLQSSEVSGEIDSCLWLLPELSIVDVSAIEGNDIHFVLDESLCNAVRLRVLNLNGSKSYGYIPNCIDKLVELEVLQFQSCRNLAGYITESICAFSRLKYLNFRDTKISGILPDCIGNLTRLREFRISGLGMTVRM